jgi:Tol biopolymer transport system component
MTDASNGPMPLSMTDLISMAEARAVAVSADGALLAWLSNASGTHQIWLRDLPDGEARQLTDMPDRIGAMAFSPVARDLVFTMDRGGDERHQLWLIPDAAGAPEPLTQDPDTVHAWGCWAPDGQDIAYSCNARDRRVMDVMVMTPATRAARCVLEGKGWCAPVCFTPDGQGLVIRESRRGPMDQDLWLLDIATGARRLLVGQGDGGAATAILAARFAPDGRLFVLCDRGDGFHALHALDPDRGEMIAVAQVPGQDVELFSQPPGQARLAFVANDAGYSRLHLRERFDEPGREIALPAPGVVSSLRFDPDGTALLLSFETACDPSSVWRYDLEAKRFEALSDAAARRHSARGADHAGARGIHDLRRHGRARLRLSASPPGGQAARPLHGPWRPGIAVASGLPRRSAALRRSRHHWSSPRTCAAAPATGAPITSWTTANAGSMRCAICATWPRPSPAGPRSMPAGSARWASPMAATS